MLRAQSTHVVPGCDKHGSLSRVQSSSLVSQFTPQCIGCCVIGFTAHVQVYESPVMDASMLESAHVPPF